MFKNKELNITIDCNLEIINFKRKRMILPAYKKPNEETNYLQ